MTTDPLVLVPEVERATARLLDTVATLAGDDATLPSLLPGWTRGHVLAHVARNADGMVNLLTWARTGVPTPQYESMATRDADIEAGAARPLEEHLADVRASADRFTGAVAAMPASGWSAVVQTAGGAHLPAARLVWLRLREVEMHHVDLAGAYRPADWPASFTLRLLREVAGTVAGLPDAPPLVLRTTDPEQELRLGAADQAPAVHGPAYAMAAWLTGRSTGTDLTVSPPQPLPAPPQWM